MCDENHLPARSGLLNARYKNVVHCLVVEILFGLVNDDRDVRSINQKVKDEEQCSPLTWRELLYVFSAHLSVKNGVR